MDDDSLRRGKPSCHIKFNEGQAILAGDALQSLAFQVLSDNNLNIHNDIKIKIINILSESIGLNGMALAGQRIVPVEMEATNYLQSLGGDF